ncbi:MAG: glycosyltransferase family 2 protein [Anaerolineaceae bacterium]|nr:glycosyltransferase family 2 protein [Anaerolineaceae bacterium]
MTRQSIDQSAQTGWPSVSVIIVTYNSGPFIVDCLEALQATIIQPHEIIVFDNASADNTVQLIQEKFTAVHLQSSNTNIGFAAANNCAAKLATGEYVAFLNPDTIVEANWLQPLLETLAADKTIGAVTPQIVFAHEPDRVNTCGNTVHFSGLTYCEKYGKPVSKTAPYTVSAVSGAAFVMRRDLFSSLAGFEEMFFMYYEDTDLSLRIRCAGYACTAVPNSIVRHAYTSSFSPRKMFYLERNRYLSLFSLMNGWLLLLMAPSILLMEFVSWGYAVLQGKKQVKAKWRAWRALFQERNWIATRRQKLTCAQPTHLIAVFSARLNAQYVSNKNPVLLRGVETAAWLMAAPGLRLAKWIYR